jgi:hypothetical protein
MTTTMEVPIMQADKSKKNAGKDKPKKTVKEAVAKFVGEVENMHKIDVFNVFGDNYRVNVWTKEGTEHGITHSYSIVQSYFMKFKDGKLVDLTEKNTRRSGFFS